MKAILFFSVFTLLAGSEQRFRQAAEKGDVDYVRTALEEGAVDPSCESLAFTLAVQNNHSSIVRLLLQDGRVLALEKKRLQFAAKCAAVRGSLETLRLLVGSNLVDVTLDYYRLIERAFLNKRADTLLYLLAQPQVSWEETSWAIRRYDHSLSDHYDLIKAIKEGNFYQFDLIMFTTQSGHLKIVDWAVECAKINSDRAILMYAIYFVREATMTFDPTETPRLAGIQRLFSNVPLFQMSKRSKDLPAEIVQIIFKLAAQSI